MRITGLCSASDCFGFVRSRTMRNRQTSCLRLKTSVNLHIEQMMRTRNFRVRNDVVERGAVTKSSKGENAYVERKVRVCFQWKAHGQCSKGDSCSFSRDKLVQGQRRKGRSSSPAPNSKAKTDEKVAVPSHVFKIRHVDSGILPCVKTTSLSADSDMLRLRRSPAKKQRKVVRKDQLHY